MKKYLSIFAALAVMVALTVIFGGAETAGALSMTTLAVVPLVTGPVKTDGVYVSAPGDGVAVTDKPLDTADADANAPDLLLPDIEQEILKMKPESTPIDQMLRQPGVKTRNVDSMEFGFYGVDTKPITAKFVDQAASGTAGRYIVNTDNNDNFDVSDTIAVPSVKASDDSDESLVLYVCAKNEAGSLICAVLNGKDIKRGATVTGKEMPDTIAKDTIMVRMGRAAGELDVQTPSIEALPERHTNYCQIFKAQVEESTILAASRKEVGWSFNDIEEIAMYDFRKSIENSYLFGVKAKYFDPVRKTNVWTTAGIWNQVSKEFRYKQGEWTQAKFVDLCQHVFCGNNGSNKRCAIMGSDLISEISKLYLNKDVHAMDQEVIAGITWNKIVTNFGTLYCLHDEMFNQRGMSGDGLIFDPALLEKAVFKPMNKLDLDLVKSGQRDTTARVITEISGVIVKYPDCHCKIIREV